MKRPSIYLSVFVFAIASHAWGAVNLEQCPHPAMDIHLNQEDKASKNSLIDALRIVSFYTFRYTPLVVEENQAAIRVELPEACNDSECAEELGWSEMQARLSHLPGVAMACALIEDDQSKQDESKQDDAKQDEPKEDGGGEQCRGGSIIGSRCIFPGGYEGKKDGSE